MKFLVVVLVLVLGVQVHGAGPDESCDEASARYVPGVSRQSKLHIWMYGPDKSSTTNSDIVTNQDVPSSTDRKDFSERYRQNPDFYGTQVDVQSQLRADHRQPEQNPKPKGTGRRQRSPQARARRRQRKLIALHRKCALAECQSEEMRLNEELVAAQYKRDYARVTELRSSLVEVKEKKAEINIRFAPPAPLGPPDGSKKKDRPATHAGTAPEVQQNLEDDSGTESLDTPSPLVRGVSPETRAVQVMPESAAAAIAAGSWGSPAIPVAVPVYVTFPTSAYYEVQALYPASGPINPGYYMQNVAGGGGFMNPAYYHGGYSAEAVASYGPAAGGMPGQQSYAGFPQQGYGGGRSY